MEFFGPNKFDYFQYTAVEGSVDCRHQYTAVERALEFLDQPDSCSWNWQRVDKYECTFSVGGSRPAYSGDQSAAVAWPPAAGHKSAAVARSHLADQHCSPIGQLVSAGFFPPTRSVTYHLTEAQNEWTVVQGQF